MKEHPILFSGRMIRAILAGKKTQTRRVIKPQPQPNGGIECAPVKPYLTPINTWTWVLAATGMGDGTSGVACPYGVPGDRLWVRETWCHKFDDKGFHVYNADGNLDSSCCYFRADGQEIVCKDEDGDLRYTIRGAVRSPWLPSIHMPRWASRLTLEVVAVRAERLQDISNDDAAAEGCPGWVDVPHPDFGSTDGQGPWEQFRDLWDSINGKRPGCSWADNPWVWAITFRDISGHRQETGV